MEVSSSAITGSMRVGLQIISSHKKPVLEVYHQLRNTFGPEIEYEMPGIVSGSDNKLKNHRIHDIFVQFTLINIGGERAENIKLSLSGDLQRNSDRPMSDIFHTIIPQMASGQTHFLFRLDNHDLQVYPKGGGKSQGLKDQSLTIKVEYDAPKGFINWFLSIPSKIRRKRRFETIYTFTPKLVAGDLPAAEYA
jgi:hypothetical protein